ncbi:salicylate synthase [Actinokineospora iranica]|uniref:Anthranilate synthase component 1/salicylate synthetase n=1 Tax=Actinokineospora iranica TaxID=1271860 RepID=A0A1G6VVM3_9PSEU|nr:salicylate synthase [Actinokineospora iranica]SDD57598.1 anthranilate synthase component 1/salicylate synthetase [Actinokineospora iranica]
MESAPSSRNFVSACLEGRFTPGILAAHLTESGLFDSAVLVERDGECRVGLGAVVRVTVDHDEIRCWTGDGVQRRPRPRAALDAVREALANSPVRDWTAYGWIGFDYSHGRAELGGPPPTGVLVHVVVPHTEVVIHADRLVVRSAEHATLVEVVDFLSGPHPCRVYTPRPVEVDRGRGAFEEMVRRCVAEIRAGAAHKVVLSRSVPVKFTPDLVGTYIQGRAANPLAHSFLVRLGDRHAVGFSPERLLEITAGGRVCAEPLAGTRAHGLGDERDRQLRATLLADPKEIYEHAITVRAARDELVAVCAPHSVAVHDFLSVRERGTVQHLGSSVVGRLDPGRTAWQALDAVFPAVTVTGVDKVDALSRIAELEDSPRGLYGGAVLVADHTGTMDAILVLRTVFHEQGRAWVRAGAGIVADSTPAREYEETCEKLRGIAAHVVPLEAP